MKKIFDGHSYGNPDASTAVMMMHGFGANSADLVALAYEIDPKKENAWYFPNAPFPLMWAGSFAWFPSDPKKQEQALNGDYFDKLDDLYDPSIDQSLAIVKKITEDFEHKNWVLGGFSQGSMMALRLALEPNVKTRALLLFSSALFGKTVLKALIEKQRARFPILQSHGSHDQVLSIASAIRLRDLLVEHGHDINWHSFQGGHQIDGEALSLAQKMITKVNVDSQQ